MTESEQRDTNDWVHGIAKELDKRTNNNISWTTLLSALGFAGSVIYGAWALEQSQLASVKETIAQLRAELVRRETEIKTIIDVSNKMNMDRLGQIEHELQTRRNQFTDIREYNEFKARMLDEIKTIRDQIHILEQTRPTTGELQGANTSINERINKLYELYQDLNKSTKHGNSPL